MIFSLNTDDFKAICNVNQTFPLLRSVYNILKNETKKNLF